MIDHFIDIYSKLVIGVISFIAPVTSYLLSTFIQDRSRILSRLAVQREAIDSVLQENMQVRSVQGASARDIIRNGNQDLKVLEDEINTKVALLEYLNPGRRIVILFSLLFASIAVLMGDVLLRGNIFGLYSHLASVTLLCASTFLFLISLITLRTTALRLIEAKELLIQDQEELRVASISVPVEQETK